MWRGRKKFENVVIPFIVLFLIEETKATKICRTTPGLHGHQYCDTPKESTALILHPQIRQKLATPRRRTPLQNANPSSYNYFYAVKNYYPVPPPRSQMETSVLNHQSRLDLFSDVANIFKMPSPPKPPPSLSNTSVIEGSGPYLCILRASSELNSGVTSIFVRDVGFYHCSFQQARRIKLMVLGAGFYHCIYQRPGSPITVRQGVGQYFCFFQGTRFARGFIIPPKEGGRKPPPPMEKRNFLEFFGSLNYKIWKGQTAPLGQFQLLGIYTYGPEGSNRNFGLLQATENFNIDLESLSMTSELDDAAEKRSNVGVKQLGQFQYHFNGADVDLGRADQFENFAYNFVHTFDPPHHVITLQVTRYNFEGQGRSFIDDQNFVQLWGLYEFHFDPEKKISTQPQQANLRLIIMTQYDLTQFVDGSSMGLGSTPKILEGDGLDFVHLIFQYSESFEGFGPSDTGSLTLTLAYQGNYNEENRIELTQDGVMATDFLLGIFQLRYVFVGKESGGVGGFIQFYAIYQHQLKSPERAPGYFQILGQYGRTYSNLVLPPLGLSSMFTWTVQGIAEYVFPDEELSNGFVKLQCQYVVDTSHWLSEEGRPSSVTLIGLYQCIWFGKRVMIKTFCYIQLYAFYQGDFGVKKRFPDGITEDGGQAVLLVQLYQEV